MPVSQAAMLQVVKLMERRQWPAAEAALADLRRGAPRDPYVLFNLGMVQFETGRPADAAASWRATLDADPRFLLAMVNLGSLLLRTGNPRGALRYAQMAVTQEPRNPDLLRNLALALAALGEQREALAAVERGLALRPADPPLRGLRLQALRHLERWAEARAAAAELFATPYGQQHLPSLYHGLKSAAVLSDWPFLARHQGLLTAAAARPGARFNPVNLAFSCDDPALLHQVAVNEAAALGCAPRPGRRWRDGRFTIGYLSPDLREHPVAHMLLTVLRHHDRARVRVVALDLWEDDGSPLRRALLAETDAQVDLKAVSAAQVPEVLREAGIDVLVDLAGVTSFSRPDLLAARPCAVQLLWLGCAASTGMRHYDGWLVDGVVAPPGYEQHCSEPLVRLPCCYHPIGTGLAGPAEADESTPTRTSLGLPADAPVVAMLQQPDRVRPPFIDLVVAAVARQPRAHLWLRVRAEARPAVLAQLAAMGLPAERVHFAAIFPRRADYLAALALADLIVDSHPYGGHSTTGEALCLGVPVLTVAGRAIHARVAASMLHELGLGDLVAADHAALAATLDRLLAEADLLGAWRARFAAAAREPAEARHRRLAAALENACTAALLAAPMEPPAG